MHADTTAYISRYHEGQLPRGWAAGNTDYQKARVIATLAHHLTRDPNDPELPGCDQTYQENRIGVVEGIMRGAAPNPVDPPFYHAAYYLYREMLTALKETNTNA